MLKVRLTTGKFLELLVKKPKKDKPQEQDHIQNYGHMVLELGLLYKDLLDMVKLPNRDRSIVILKFCMLVFKANSNLSKYALEILRLLVHQQSSLSLKAACEEFYGLFVNTKGKLDSHIPVDEQMEWIVGQVKAHIKHMHSNKTEKNITTRTRALAGIKDIGGNYDQATEVIVRAKRHTVPTAQADELAIVEDLRQIRPFERRGGRTHESFPNISRSMVERLEVPRILHWVQTRTYRFATELGN